MTTDTATALREWARGMFTTEAATELLIGSFRGRFAAVGYPWVQPRTMTGSGSTSTPYPPRLERYPAASGPCC